MTDMLCSACVGLLVCIAFAMGYLLGQRNLPRMPPAVKAEEDAQKRRQYEDELKAFTECMNYSAEAAYGGLRHE